MSEVVDWAVLDIPGVGRAAHGAAVKVSEDRPHVAEYDDMKQEALLYAATHPDEVRGYLRDGALEIGLLSHRLYSRLLDKTDALANVTARSVSYEAARSGVE